MAIHLAISVDIDVPAIENALEHASVAVESGVMTGSEAVDWLSEDLLRFVTAS
jgi:hypothetical protein